MKITMIFSMFRNVEEKEKSEAIENLICESTPRREFFMMVILSIAMSTCGLLLNSAAVIIGSMLIAPILSPILSLSLGIVMSDYKLIKRSFYTLLKSILFSLAAAVIIALFLLPQEYGMTPEIESRTEVSIVYIIIAMVAGVAASFAYVKTNLNKTLPGVAISVAIIPPLAVCGIGIAMLDWDVISKSFFLFGSNIVGIIFASTIVFSLMNIGNKKKIAEVIVKKEDKELEKENKK